MLKKHIYEYSTNPFMDFNNKWPIIVCGDKYIGYNGMTVSWGGLGVLWGKNVCFIFVRKSRHTYKFIENSDSITISFLNDNYKEAKSYFGRYSGRDVNKFEQTNLHPTFDVDYNGYYIAEADYVIKCKKIYSVDIPYEELDKSIIDRYYPNGDMHTMYVCEVKQYLINEK